GLARRILLYQEEKKSTNAMAQHRELNQLKQTEYPWMYEVSKCAPQEALRDLDRAFKNFFAGLKAGQKIGFPKFKKKGIHDSFRLTGSIKIKSKAVQLPRLGVIRLKEKPRTNGRILSATVNREADRWYVSLTCETEIPDPTPVKGEITGIDVGLNHFAVLSDGTKIEAPKPLAKYL
ncbi:RNA-guided endonuclease InsQ/TnpB family protein, partial [Desulfotomaculum copahuensis]|uniref:RNA-guided endonuclease InsQ/TnpB family protein n=1 Tax=Desulfotomaculum copahuensis TaxID=1838280 RepID=UPI000A5DDDD8